MSHPHVLMINKAYPPWVGGIERHVADVGSALVRRGWTVSAVVANAGKFETRERLGGVDVHRLPTRMRLYSTPWVRGLRSRIRALKPDLVHVHVPNPMAWFAVQRLSKDVPVVCTWHSDIVRQRWLAPLYRPMELDFLKRCDRIIATSGVLAHYSEPLQAHQAKCEVIPLCLPPHGISTELIQSTVEQFRRVRTLPVFVFVGRLVSYKGLPYLIRAIRNVDAELWIAGDGPLKPYMEQLVDRLGVSRRVRFLGRVREHEKIALFRIAHACVLPSIQRSEAFGYCLLEALREGCPLVTTDLPTGVRWVNQHERTGLVVPPASTDALEGALVRLRSDAALREYFTRQSRIWYDETFPFEGAMDAHEVLYHQLVG